MTDADGRPGARLELDGALNVRDLGGWATPAGPVAYGLLYRSDRLNSLTDADLDTLSARNIETVIDFRSEIEAEAHPSRLWPTVSRHLEVPIGSVVANQKTFFDRALDGEIDELTEADMAETYVEILTYSGEQFGRAVEAALDGGPALYHCTAGKDRTGLLTMLILATLGVSDDDILTDFGLSNAYRSEIRMVELKPLFDERGLDVERFRPGFTAPRSAMEHAMGWLADNHGDAARYLGESAGVTDARARLTAHLVDRT
ncbi:MAG: tyrosine-protein phosphatase [Actinomycetota bacterium]